MKRLWKNYSLTIVLAALFLVSWVAHAYTGWVKFAAEQEEHGAQATVLGKDGYIYEFAAATMENWQSEFLQLLTFVVLTTYLVHKGSHESKDTDEQMQRQLDRIEKRLRELGPRGEGHSA